MIWVFGLLVILLLIVAAVQRSQIKQLTAESARLKNLAAVYGYRREELKQRLLAIRRMCGDQETKE